MKKATAKKSTTVKKPMTFAANVVDTSASMSGIIREATRAANDLRTGYAQSSKQTKMPVSLSLYTFDSVVKPIYENMGTTEAPDFKCPSYSELGGSTALFAGLKRAIDALKGFGLLSKNKKDAFIVTLITDGGENSSPNLGVTPGDVVKEMKELMAQGNWTFVFQVPRGQQQNFSYRYGIPLDNITEWEQTVEGTQEVSAKTTSGVASFMKSRSAGKTQTNSFYTDMSKVSATKVKRACDDLSKNFRFLSVPKEAVIKDFVEEKTKKPYVIGAAYYQLMKPEKVQAAKTVLIVPKNTKTVYGGDEARELVGIPVGQEAKVTPGNHANFDIYVRSTSVNRKLPRGTKVLLDKTQVTNAKSTWDHNAAANQALVA